MGDVSEADVGGDVDDPQPGADAFPGSGRETLHRSSPPVAGLEATWDSRRGPGWHGTYPVWLLVGQGVGLVDSVGTAAEIISAMVADATQQCGPLTVVRATVRGP